MISHAISSLEENRMFPREGVSQLEALVWAARSRRGLEIGCTVLHTQNRRSIKRKVERSNCIKLCRSFTREVGQSRKSVQCLVNHVLQGQFEGSSRGKTSFAGAQSPDDDIRFRRGIRHTPRLGRSYTLFPHAHFHEKLDIFGPPTLIAEHTAES